MAILRTNYNPAIENYIRILAARALPDVDTENIEFSKLVQLWLHALAGQELPKPGGQQAAEVLANNRLKRWPEKGTK